ncbi:hypothetical protein PVAND_007630 [Polypedilum vanderplanki]|uniref:Uncharacterized protein n=1 Tax=Polypedilum vanderplanki TaxID=319348 RepID=A0A9J6C795_POLVA|nr:hypothetical protein PVAND_007630 [Polypedilum vanderplanki]
MKTLVLVTAIAFIIVIVNASEKVTNNKNATTKAVKTKEARGKRNLNFYGNFGANRREDGGYDYSPTGYSYEPSNYIGGGSAANFHHTPHHYPEPPEPIIEIIIQDNNETLPEPQPIVQNIGGKKKKEQVQVFYVKYHKDEKKGLVIHEPVAALSPSGHEQHDEEEIHDDPIIVTPVPNIPKKTTTFRTIIRPESEQYESSNGVHVTFNHPHNHHSKSDNHFHHDEDKVESAIQPVIQLPQSRIGPLSVVPLTKEKRTPQLPAPPPAHITQGRVVNSPPQQQQQQHSNFHLPPQPLIQSLPHQRPHIDFNPQNNFVTHQGILPNQLTLPSQDPSKPFHPNGPSFNQQQQFNIRPQQPVSIPINHQQQHSNQFNQLGHQQFNQPPRGLPPPTQIVQQQPLLKPPQKPPVNVNFNQNQRPFNYHAHQNQVQPQIRFPVQQQSQQTLQRPLQVAPPRQNNFPSQQLPPLNRPPIQFNSQSQFPPSIQSQQFPPNQGPPLNFKPEPKPSQQIHHHSQPLHQHNQFAAQQNAIIQQQPNHNIFQGGLVEQAAPNLAGSRPQFIQQSQPTFQSQEDARFHQQQHNFIQSNFGTDVQVSSSVPKFEHHITETVNPPVFYQSTAVDMERNHHDKNIGPLVGNIGHLSVTQQPKIISENQHRFAINQHQQQHQVQQQQQQHGSVSNHFSQVFPQIDNQQKQFTTQSFVELNGRNNNNFITESRAPSSIAPTPSTVAPTTARKVVSSTTTTSQPKVSSTTNKPPAYFDLPDEIPDDLRKQLEESGVLENAQISILDYDKIGDTSLQDLPPEHLANFFSAGGGAQIGASNKVISVLKPNGESVDDKVEVLQNNRDVAKLLSNAGKLPVKKEDVSLKVVKFDMQSHRNSPEQYIQQDAKVLPTTNHNQNYSRYLPIKINSAHFPIPDAEELRGKKISSVVVLAPVSQDEENNNDEGHQEDRDAFEAKQIKFLTGEILKNLIKKPSSENFKKWLEREQKTNPDLQSVVLLVTKDNLTNEQEIYMYDIATKSVSRLSGELSSKFVNVAEENAAAQDENGSLMAEQIDRIDTNIEEDQEAEPSNIVESIASLDAKPEEEEKSIEGENKVLISSGYSVIKND